MMRVFSLFWSLMAEKALADDSAASVYELFRWVVAEGGSIDERQIVQDFLPGVRGVFATEDIPVDTVLARIPQRLHITGDGCGLAEATRVELQLGSESRLAPYMKNLEGHVSAIPDYWSPEVLDVILRLPPYDWRRHSNWFNSSCAGDLEDPNTKRALELLVSRACGGPDDTTILIPVYDLYNHRNGDWDNTMTFNSDGMHEIKTSRDVRAGEQLYNSYGKETLDFVRDYGFVEPKPQKWQFGDLAFVVDENDEISHWGPKRPTLSAFFGATDDVRRELAREVALPELRLEKDRRDLKLAVAYRESIRSALDIAAADLKGSIPEEL